MKGGIYIGHYNKIIIIMKDNTNICIAHEYYLNTLGIYSLYIFLQWTNPITLYKRYNPFA